jgi:hypothetical protein
MSEVKSWEHPYCPSGELQEVFELAEKFRAIQQDPAVRVDIFLLALILMIYPPLAEDVVELFAEVKDKWRASL